MTQCTVTPEILCFEERQRPGPVTALLAWGRLQLRRRRTRRQLAALPDYLLRDLGLTRYDVQQEITSSFWRRR